MLWVHSLCASSLDCARKLAIKNNLPKAGKLKVLVVLSKLFIQTLNMNPLSLPCWRI